MTPKSAATRLWKKEKKMFLINQAMVDVPIGTAALIVVLGMAVVFFGLILLMLVTKASGKIMQNKEAAAKPPHLLLLPQPPLPLRPPQRRLRPAPQAK